MSHRSMDAFYGVVMPIIIAAAVIIAVALVGA